MKGRKPKPVALQIAEGDPRKRGVHKLTELLNAEPPATKGLPPCPPHLKGRARGAWGFWAEELGKMNLDCRPDAQMLEGACVNYSRAVDADIAIAKDGITVEEATVDPESGERIVLRIRAHPAIAISNQAWRLLHRFCSEFGLSPVSRTRLTIDKKDKHGEDLATLLNRPREAKAAGVSVQ